jgi:Glyoxalase/Bleomycin resistance protein/Dioxygenase superfamily
MSTTTTGLDRLSLVCIPSPEQDKAVEFYEQLGFEKRTDVPFGNGYRWIEVYLPDNSTGIALAPPPPGKSVEGAETGVTLTTDAEVSRMGDPVPPMFWFRDPNGNTLMVVEQPPN